MPEKEEGRDGSEGRAAGKVFVLAAGGIENPRLLLLSNERSPAGIGNAHDVVGRYFMDHFHVLGNLVPSDRALLDRAGLYDVRALPDGRVMELAAPMRRFAELPRTCRSNWLPYRATA